MRMKMWLCVMLAVSLGNPTAAQAADAAAKPKLRGWLAQECPTQPPPKDVKARFAGAEMLVSWGIGLIFDKLGEALTEAAKVDKEGQSTKSTTPSYLFRYTGIAGQPVSPQRCVIVAHAASRPKSWCKSAPFKDARLCAATSDLDSRPRAETLLENIDGVPTLTGDLPPKFYAEIELLASADARGFIPRLQALYYEGGMHDGRKFKGDAPRNVLISVSGKSPSGTADFSAVSVHLKEFVPSKELVVRTPNAPHAILDRAVDPVWANIIRPPYYYRRPTAGDLVYPVNLSVEIREVGKPNEFLQALAQAFDADSAADWARGQLLPSERAQAEAAEQSEQLAGQVKYQTALVEVFKADAGLRAACDKPSETAQEAGRAELLQVIATALAARAKVRIIELELNISPREVFTPDIPASAGTTGTALTICKQVLNL